MLAEAGDARPGMAILAGEAGIGKSHLVNALESAARARGFVVLHGESVAFGGERFAYAPVVSALRDLPAEWAEEAIGPEARRALARLLPGIEPPEHDEPGARPAPGQCSVLLTDMLVRFAAERAPVLLAFEDLHWADRWSREFVAYLARNLRGRIACVATFRTGELPAEHALRRLLAELPRMPTVARIDLPPLTEMEIVRLLEAIAGGPVASSLVRELHRRAGGNPFLLEELFAAHRSAEAGGVPATLADAILVRVRRLDAATRRILSIVAAAGGRIDHRVLADVAGPADVPAPLRAALEAGMLVRDRDDRGVGFRHGLVAEILYADLLPGERVELHEALARALTAVPGSPAAQLADHWYHAGRAGEALQASLTAGLEAARLFAFAEAQTHLERTLDLWATVRPEPHALGVDRVELLSRAAEAARFSGDTERSIALGREALAEVDASTDPARAARLFERLGEAHFWDDETALDCYRRALALLPARPTAERARLLAAEGRSLMGLGRWAEARERCEAALRMSQEVGTGEADPGARTTLGLVLGFLGETEAGGAHLRRALEAARATGPADEVARAYIHLGELLRLRGDHEGALRVMDEGESYAARVGMKGCFGRFMFVNGADDLLRLGRWDEVAGRLREAERMDLGLTTEAMYRAIAAQLHAMRGDAQVARHHLERALAIADGLPGEFVTPARTAGAILALAERAPAQARDHVAAALAVVGSSDPLYLPPLLCAGVRAEAELARTAHARRDAPGAVRALDRARELVAMLDGIAGAGSPPDALAHQALAHAELSRGEGAADPAAWEQAAARFAALGEPHQAGYARLRQAEAMLALGGERRAAARLLSSACRTATALGAAALLEDAAALARCARLSLEVDETEGPAPGPAPPMGLTPREAEVLQLVADGLSNREIGRRLFITQNTVGTHIGHIFDKLDVHTRVEAAGRAGELRPAP